MQVLLLALALWLGWADPAHAAFLIPFVLPLVGGSLFLANVVVYGGGIALSMGLSWAANKFFGPKQAAGQEQQSAVGVELDLRVDADVPEKLIVGRAVVAGSLSTAETYGKRGDIDNSDLIQNIAIADHPCQGLVKAFVDAQEATLAAPAVETPDKEYGTDADDRGQVVDGYDQKIALKFYDGTQTTADALAVAGLSSHAERPYTSARVGRGRTYARIHSIYDKEKVTGPLRWRFVVDGIKLYNPALDTTVGGSGAHRWGDLATHEFSSNLAVIAYNILRGIRVKDSGGTPRHFYGLENTPAASLPLANWFAAIAECDVDIDGEPQFHGGAEISVDTEPLEAIRQILKSCDGRLSELGGVYKLHVGAPGLPVTTYDDGVLRANAGDTFLPILPLTQRVNYVTGSYTSPEDGWVPKVAPPRTDADMEDEDGRRLPADLDVPMVQTAAHMQRLQKQMLLRSRRERRHTEPLPPSRFGLEPGDIIERNSVRNGYVDKLFEVDGVDLDSNLNSVVSLIEIDPDDYDWDAATDLIAQPAGTLVVSRPSPKIIEGFDADPVLHTGDNGVEKPAIQVTWDVPEDGDLSAVDIEVRQASAPLDVANYLGNDVTFESVLIVSGLAPATNYEVRGKYRSFNGYETAWSLWIPVLTDDTRVDEGELADVINAKITDARRAVAALSGMALDGSTDNLVPLPLGSIKDRLDAVGDAVVANLLRVQSVENNLRDAGIDVDPAGGRVTIWALDQHRDVFGVYQSTVTALFDAVTASINLRATHTDLAEVAAAVVAGFDPVYRWEYNGTVEGWTVSGASLAAGAAAITVDCAGSGAYIESPTLSFDAGTYKIIQIKIKRTAGSGFGLVMKWGASFAESVTFDVPMTPTSYNSLALDMTGVAAWTGTLTAIRFYVGADATDTFEIDYAAIGNSQLQALILSGIDGRLTTAEADIDALDAAITLRVTTTTFNVLAGRVTDAEGRITIAEGDISLKASTSTVTALSDTVTNVQASLNSLTGTFTLFLDTSRESTFEAAAGEGAIHALLEGQRGHDLVQTSTAAIKQELSVKVDDQGFAIATSLVQLQSQTDNSVALINDSLTTTAGNLAAIANRTTALESTVNDATLGVLARARVTASDSASVTFAGGQVVSTASRVATLEGVVTDPTTGLSTRASITTVSALDIDLDRVLLRHGVLGTINGVTGGFVLTGIGQLDGLVSYSVEIDGDLIVTGSIIGAKLEALSITAGLIAAGAVTATHVGANEIITQSANIANLTVDTIKIADAAVTVPRFGTVSSSFFSTFNTYVDVVVNSHTFTTTIGSEVSFLVNTELWGSHDNPGSGVNMICILFIDGVQVAVRTLSGLNGVFPNTLLFNPTGFHKVVCSSVPQTVVCRMQLWANTSQILITDKTKMFSVAYKK